MGQGEGHTPCGDCGEGVGHRGRVTLLVVSSEVGGTHKGREGDIPDGG